MENGPLIERESIQTGTSMVFRAVIHTLLVVLIDFTQNFETKWTIGPLLQCTSAPAGYFAPQGKTFLAKSQRKQKNPTAEDPWADVVFGSCVIMNGPYGER